MTETAAERFLARWGMAAFKARCFIQGTIVNPTTKSTEPHSAHWSQIFRDHHTVQLAEREGWSRQLRSAVFMLVRRAIMDGKPCDDLSQFMPGELWIKHTRERCAIEREAAESQKENPFRFDRPARTQFKKTDVTRQPMTDMQRASRNKDLHREPLTERSRRMMGDN